MAGHQASFVLISKSPQETFQIGRIIGEGLKGGDCIAMTGELGAGKTCLTQGIANGLGVPDRYAVTSPTFTLINEYPGREMTLIHMDVYRLTGSAELDEMGYEEYLHGGGVMVIEWAEKIMDAIPDKAMYLECSYLDDNTREIKISGCSGRIRTWKKNLKEGG